MYVKYVYVCTSNYVINNLKNILKKIMGLIFIFFVSKANTGMYVPSAVPYTFMYVMYT